MAYTLGDVVTNLTVEQRFWKYVLMTDSCWNWCGAVSKGGYGNFRNGLKQNLPHRYIYQKLFGMTDLQIDHLCKNRLCVNPDHLEAVTARENVRRSSAPTAKNMAKTECKRGHNLDIANTCVNNQGRRVCRACNRLRARYYRTGEKNGL